MSTSFNVADVGLSGEIRSHKCLARLSFCMSGQCQPRYHPRAAGRGVVFLTSPENEILLQSLFSLKSRRRVGRGLVAWSCALRCLARLVSDSGATMLKSLRSHSSFMAPCWALRRGKDHIMRLGRIRNAGFTATRPNTGIERKAANQPCARKNSAGLKISPSFQFKLAICIRFAPFSGCAISMNACHNHVGVESYL